MRLPIRFFLLVLLICVLTSCPGVTDQPTVERSKTPLVASGLTETPQSPLTPRRLCWVEPPKVVCDPTTNPYSDESTRYRYGIVVSQLESTERRLSIELPRQATNARIDLLEWSLPQEVMQGITYPVANLEITNPDEAKILTTLDPPLELRVECPVVDCGPEHSEFTLKFYDENRSEWVDFDENRLRAAWLENGFGSDRWVLRVLVSNWGDRHIAW